MRLVRHGAGRAPELKTEVETDAIYLTMSPLAALVLAYRPEALVLFIGPLLGLYRMSHCANARSEANDEIVRALVAVAETNDAYTGGHGGRVAELCEIIARHRRYSADAVREARIAGLLHDIGKVAVDPDIIDKVGPLAELRRRAGTQFDPELVEALALSVAEHDWVPFTATQHADAAPLTVPELTPHGVLQPV